jgi:hypothetical protein
MTDRRHLVPAIFSRSGGRESSSDRLVSSTKLDFEDGHTLRFHAARALLWQRMTGG